MLLRVVARLPQRITVRTPIVDPSLLQDSPLKIRIEDPSKSNQGKYKTFSNIRPSMEYKTPLLYQ